MEVVRWLCSQPQASHTRTWFFVHSHNGEAAELMIRCLHEHGYQAVYRPFGIDVLAWFSAQPIDEPAQPPPPEPEPVPASPRPAQLVRPAVGTVPSLRARQRLNADEVGLTRDEPPSGSSSFGAE